MDINFVVVSGLVVVFEYVVVVLLYLGWLFIIIGYMDLELRI